MGVVQLKNCLYISIVLWRQAFWFLCIVVTSRFLPLFDIAVFWNAAIKKKDPIIKIESQKLNINNI